jgi:hypothetical protein
MACIATPATPLASSAIPTLQLSLGGDNGVCGVVTLVEDEAGTELKFLAIDKGAERALLARLRVAGGAAFGVFCAVILYALRERERRELTLLIGLTGC